MASESETEKRETLADIVAMLRANARGERFDEFSFTSLADRIEAAWKREREEIEAQALSIGGIVESSRHTQKPQGNAAALREAVVALLDALDSLGCDESTATLAALVPDMADSSARCLAAFRKAKAALAAPQRNCDAMPWRKAWDEWRAKHHPHNPQTFNESYEATVAFMEWFTAPASEKGATA